MLTIIRKQRLSLGLTQKELGRVVNISQGSLSDLEKAIRPIGLKRAHRLAAVLGLTIEESFDSKGYAVLLTGSRSRE